MAQTGLNLPIWAGLFSVQALGQFWGQINSIQSFLARSGLHSGGVLLVTGLHGSGKTRLVDEALNAQEAPKPNLLQQLILPLLGRDPIRKRRQQKHFPRGVKRIILLVSIEPFFPHSEESGSSDDHSLLLEKQREQDVLTLLHNVVFALTSFIDARGASYKHGRTPGVWVGSGCGSARLHYIARKGYRAGSGC